MSNYENTEPHRLLRIPEEAITGLFASMHERSRVAGGADALSSKSPSGYVHYSTIPDLEAEFSSSESESDQIRKCIKPARPKCSGENTRSIV